MPEELSATTSCDESMDGAGPFHRKASGWRVATARQRHVALVPRYERSLRAPSIAGSPEPDVRPLRSGEDGGISDGCPLAALSAPSFPAALAFTSALART